MSVLALLAVVVVLMFLSPPLFCSLCGIYHTHIDRHDLTLSIIAFVGHPTQCVRQYAA